MRSKAVKSVGSVTLAAGGAATAPKSVSLVQRRSQAYSSRKSHKSSGYDCFKGKVPRACSQGSRESLMSPHLNKGTAPITTIGHKSFGDLKKVGSKIKKGLKKRLGEEDTILIVLNRPQVTTQFSI